MDTNLLALVFSAITGLTALGGAAYMARRFQKMGGGAAQEKLNSTYRELNEAFNEQIETLKVENETLKTERAGFMEERAALRKERLQLTLDIDELREELRRLRRRAAKGEAETKSVAERTRVLEDHNGGSE